MKKILTYVFLLIAVASFGGITTSAHAQTATLTPAQTAALQQSLDVLKAKLSTLEAQAATQSSAPAGTSVSVPAVTTEQSSLSATDAIALNSALSSLASALSSLQVELAANPQLAAGREAAVVTALKGIGSTLALISNAVVANGPVSATVITPAAPVAINVGQPTAAKPSAEGSLPVAPSAEISPTAPAAPAANAVPETAQIGSAWYKNLNWPLTIVIVLVLAVIALWLFWPGEEKSGKEAASKKKVSPSTSTQAPIIVSASAPVAAPAPMKTIPQMPQPQQPQQQRKPA